MTEECLEHLDLSGLRKQLIDDGVVCVRQLFDATGLDVLRQSFEWSLSNPSENAVTFPSTEDSPGRFYADINNPFLTGNSSPYLDLFRKTYLPDLMGALWACNEVWFLYEQVLLKEGGEARRTPWHQDTSYLPVAGHELAIAWTTLEPTPQETSLEFVKGSHRGPTYDGSAFDPEDDTKPVYGDGSLPRLPDIESARNEWPIVSWDVKPGDVVIFHPATLHGGAPTQAGTCRRSVSLRFFGPNASYQPLPSNGVRDVGIEGNTVWDHLDKVLKPGDPLHHASCFFQTRPS